MKEIRVIKWIIPIKRSDDHPEWTMILGVTENKGVYIPALSDEHERVFLDICNLPVAVNDDNGHSYFPIEFMYRIYPYYKDKFDALVADLEAKGYFIFNSEFEEL